MVDDIKKRRKTIPTIDEERNKEATKKTSIQIMMSTKWALLEVGRMYETYDDVIIRLVNFWKAENYQDGMEIEFSPVNSK
jgi:hypothetical protein